MRHSTANTISIMCSCLMSALVICVMIAPQKPVKPIVKAEVVKPVVLKKPLKGRKMTKQEQRQAMAYLWGGK